MQDLAKLQKVLPKTIEIKKDYVNLIDQLKLPSQLKIVKATKWQDLVVAIKSMQIRGAQAIGGAGAAAMFLAVKNCQDKDLEIFQKNIFTIAQKIIAARPTAVNLSWAVNKCLEAAQGESIKAVRDGVCQAAHYIFISEVENNIKIGEIALDLFKDKKNIQTHCNAGSLSGIWYGTATAPIYSSFLAGNNFKVWVDETRPMLQGSRLTAWEMQRAGIDFSIVVDNACGFLHSQKMVDCVIVGADRIAANGDVANKIGTYPLALMAHENKIPFYVAAVNSTIDFNAKTGKDIKIEIRADEEITTETKYFNKISSPKSADSFNPVFDITPARLITKVITQTGIFAPNELLLNKSNFI